MHMLQWTEQTTLLPFPPVHTESFWAKCFLFVSSLCLGARDLRSFRHPWEHKPWDTFQNFFIPSSEGYRYLRWIQLYNSWADPYSTKALTNATRHLSSNIFKFILHVCEAFFRTYSEHHGVTLSQTAKTLRKKLLKRSRNTSFSTKKNGILCQETGYKHRHSTVNYSKRIINTLGITTVTPSKPLQAPQGAFN
ncbi:uncharacterized protein BYT42DRAFT_125966 [Radiomyces spectabilis]|uniref:uncharacterized protein n=1 Tax=Radiomyces spectabilis TaxID=64574 RepID=UPI00222061E6|nr:uncharacterized protein BYT42DRAFT_125966 [Radiomyces spectabilis]KAI8368305.1 hypothetical protein BYT42DRAFT_125966 [Radiomyces spectabilis]